MIFLREYICFFMKNVEGCGYFEWYDPIICERAKMIIPALLRRMNEKDASIERLKGGKES